MNKKSRKDASAPNADVVPEIPPEQILAEIGASDISGEVVPEIAAEEKPKRKYSPRKPKLPEKGFDDAKMHKLLARAWGGFFAVGTVFLAKWFGKEFLADGEDVENFGEALQTYFELKIPNFAKKPEFLLAGAFSTYLVKRIDTLMPVSQEEYQNIGTPQDTEPLA